MLLHYYIKNRIPWIFCWNFNKNYSQGIYTFTRQFKVKWWDSVKEIKFPMKKAPIPKEAENIHEFLATKNRFQCLVAESSNKADFKKNLLEVLSQIEDEEIQNPNLTQENEGDCYGIYSPIQ